MLEAGHIIRSLGYQGAAHARAKRGEVHAEFHGELATILPLASAQKRSPTPISGGVRLSVVAWVGNRIMFASYHPIGSRSMSL